MAGLKYQDVLEINKRQLTERIIVDEHFVHCHWASERALVSSIPPTAKMLLDLGCGPSGGLLRHVQDMDYSGLDLVPEYLAELRRRYPVVGQWEWNCRYWISSPMESLPFRDRYFDVVYARHSLEHSLDLDATFSEIRRVLKPGGLFIFCVPARVDDSEPAPLMRWPARKWLAAFRRVGRICFSRQHDYFTDELYGFAQRPGLVHSPLRQRAKQYVNYLRGKA